MASRKIKLQPFTVSKRPGPSTCEVLHRRLIREAPMTPAERKKALEWIETHREEIDSLKPGEEIQWWRKTRHLMINLGLLVLPEDVEEVMELETDKDG